MPHITTERVKEIRSEIKKQFPDFKFSITREHLSTISVSILEAPFDLLPDREEKYVSVNYFYIADNYKEYPQVGDVLQKIYNIMNAGNRTVSEDADYGNIPAFYVSLRIGQWDKPFKVTESVRKPEKKSEPVNAGEIKIVDYSEKAVAVIGDTYPIKEKLKELGGRFNKFLSCGAGWIFPKTKEQEIKTALSVN